MTNIDIPVVSFASFHDGDRATRTKIGKIVVDACRSVGCLFITDHLISPARLDEAFAWNKEFYDLSADDKAKAPHPPGYGHHRGYSLTPLIGGDMKGYKESFEAGSEKNTEQSNIFPPEEVLPGFRQFSLDFYADCATAAREVFQALALGMDLEDENYIAKFHSGTNNQLRMLHYPPVKWSDVPDGEMDEARLVAHADWSSVTMLFQNGVSGLQIADPSKPGSFISVPPVPYAMTMSVGDMLQRWSNDYLRSLFHRVTLPPPPEGEVTRGKEAPARYSIVYFLSPDPDLLIECLPPFTKDGNKAKYPAITQRDYNMFRWNAYTSQDK